MKRYVVKAQEGNNTVYLVREYLQFSNQYFWSRYFKAKFRTVIEAQQAITNGNIHVSGVVVENIEIYSL